MGTAKGAGLSGNYPLFQPTTREEVGDPTSRRTLAHLLLD